MTTAAEMDNDPDWRKLEQLVASIQAQLAPGASVRHNVELAGVHSETNRQIDVLIEANVGQYKFRIVLDCKDYKTPVDVKGIEEFYGLVQDVQAHKGVLVCPSGFSASAKKRAKKLDVDLYRPVDTGDHKWKAEVALPAICDVRTCAMSFRISMSQPYAFTLSEHPALLDVFTSTALPLDNALTAAIDAWNSGQLPVEPGEFGHVDLYSVETLVDNGHGMLVSVELTLSGLVEQKRYFGRLPIEKISGFEDQHTGAVITNAFSVGALDWENVRSNWQLLKDGEESPGPVALTVQALQYIGHD
ncbi:restriction endonuclease [Cupriavidus taiwanensis]|uniref:Restriction endonuclease n=1 Tax=Cupriavidus taiwanensis TaxID=164546 RepID=A0A7Z7JHW3_9BURK|nr:restriction endonuclease [Cupriavidus taiwanensis]SOZ17290.1 Restriction endonuclease [Cupriavidus taiwanensis]SOZ96389.1 Restriction endonuclease [Cupriavidus taiwanensis]SPC25664.1 Restriction endonuclease [Cupriavidus taiwanensis]